MNDSNPENTVPHELIDAEISVVGLESAADEKTVFSALEKLESVSDISISHGKVALSYEPVRITRAQIEEAIAHAGFRVGEVESAPSSPLVGDFDPQQKSSLPDDSEHGQTTVS